MRMQSSGMIRAASGVLAAAFCLVGAVRAQQYDWSTFAGNTGGPGFSDGTTARFQFPTGITADAAGNLYIADTSNHTIRKVTPAGVVTTLAGSPGIAGNTNNTGSAARFTSPQDIAVASDGSLYVTQNHMIRKVTALGEVTSFAGSSSASGSTNATGLQARFNSPAGITIDSSGNLYVADYANSIIRKITSAGVVTTIAGSAGSLGSTDGTGGAARFRFPAGVAADASGNLFVADSTNQIIRRITSSGVVTTIAGLAGNSGLVDGTGSTARFNLPQRIVFGSDGNLYVTDRYTVRRVTTAGSVTTIAGRQGFSSTNGIGTAAVFNMPSGIARIANGDLFVVDSSNHTIRRITTGQVVTTYLGGWTESGSADGAGASARFTTPAAVSVDSDSNLLIADKFNHAVRKISPTGSVTTFAGSPGFSGNTNATGSAARFRTPEGIIASPDGVVYVADTGNHTIRKITSGGQVSTFAGSPGRTGSADGTTAALFNTPRGLAIDSSGNLYVADQNNHIIRKIASDGTVSTFAGTAGIVGSADGTGPAARFSSPDGLGVDGADNLYVSEWGNHTIRKISSSGVVTTLAGTASNSGSQDATGAVARFNRPSGLTVDNAGNVYVADRFNHTIRKINPAGVVTTLGGSAATSGLIGDGIASAARFHFPLGIAVNAEGRLFVADTDNERIVQGVPVAPEISIEHSSGNGVSAGGSVNFGVVATGIASTKQFTIRNPGLLDLTISSVAVTGGNNGDFPVNISGMLSSIPAGGFTTLSVSFTPAAAGNRGTTLRLLSNDSDEGTFDIALSGTGNTPPVFSGYSASTAFQKSTSLSIAKLLRKATDTDGDTVTLTSAGPTSPNGGSAIINAGSLVYTPPSGFFGDDSFAIILTDARGASIPATVTMNVAAAVSAGQGNNAVNPPRLNVMAGGAIGVRFQGIPGRDYRIERSTDLAIWQTLVTVTAGATGEVSYTDPAPPQPNAYYRLALP